MAVKKFIDSTGLATLWEKVKALIPGIATSSKAGIVKSGGDITVASDGVVSVNDNSHSHFYEKGIFYGASGTGGYINFCTITVNSAYKNETFSMDLSSRSRYGTLIINLLCGNTTTISAPVLYWISDIHVSQPVFYKVDGNKLYLYWQKSEAYDEMTVTGLNVGLYTYKGVTFSWGNTYVTSNTGLTGVSKIDNYVNCIDLGTSTDTTYTIDSMWVDLQNKVGSTGSVYLNKKASGVGSGIVTGWYNFIYMPHRSGIGSDNHLFGSIILTPMAANDNATSWVLRVQNSATTVTAAVKLTNYSIADISGLQAALDGKSSTSHSHGLSTNNFYQLLNNTTTDSGQSMVGVTNSSGFNLLKAVRGQGSAPAWFQPDYSAGIAFGGGDTKGIMSMRYQLPSIRFAGGNGGQFKWNMTISGTSGTTYDLSTLATKTELSNRLSKTCGWCVTNVATPYWFLVAGYTCNNAWFDLNSTFIVSRNFYGIQAIVSVIIRTNDLGKLEVCQAKVISSDGSIFPANHIIVTYKATTGSNVVFQIWAKCDSQYQSMSVMNVYNGTRSQASNTADYWIPYHVTDTTTTHKAAVNSDGLFTHPTGHSMVRCTVPGLSPFRVESGDGFFTGYNWDRVFDAKTSTSGRRKYLSGTISAGGYLLIELLESGPYTSKNWGIYYLSYSSASSGSYFVAKISAGHPGALVCYNSGGGSFSLYHNVYSNFAANFYVKILRQSAVSLTWQDVIETPPSTVGIVDINNVDTRVTGLEKYNPKGSLLYINSLSDSHISQDGSGNITIDLDSNKEYYNTIVLDLMGSFSHYIPVKAIQVHSDVYSRGESIKLIFEGGPGHLIRSDERYGFAKIPNSADEFAEVNSGCYAEVVYYGRTWYTCKY